MCTYQNSMPVLVSVYLSWAKAVEATALISYTAPGSSSRCSDLQRGDSSEAAFMMEPFIVKISRAQGK